MISKSDKNIFKGHALRLGFGTLLIACLLLVSASIAQIPPPSSGGSSRGGGINGSVAYGPFTWNASNFLGFWHEDGISGETLSVNQEDLSGTQRVIIRDNLVYSTTKRVVPYKVYTEKGLTVWNGLDASGSRVIRGGYYAKAGWLGKPYVAVDGQANKLSEIVLEQNSTDVKNLTVNETWNLGNGYNLTLIGLDRMTTPKQAWFDLSNKSGIISEFIVEDGNSNTVWRNLAGESDAPFFVTYIDVISETSVRLKYTWLISDNVTIFNAAGRFGIMEVRSANTDGFSLSNENTLTLSRGSTVNLLDTLNLVVNDSSSLEYYPMIMGELPPQLMRVHNINKGTNYTTIQAAINDASPGNEIHVDSGTYYESVNITKRLTLRGIGMPVVDAGGSGSAITLSADGITLEGFTATGSRNYPDAGINVTSSNNMLIGNNASNNAYGIYLSYSSNSMLIGNDASNNIGGIFLYYSGNNMLSYNNAQKCRDGILLDYSSNNMLSGNNANSNSYQGILLYYYSNNNTISGNNANSNTYHGISIDDSSNNTLSWNNANSNHQYSITLSSSSNNNMLIGNNASSNGWYGFAIFDSSNNMLIGNNASSNGGYGIGIFDSSNNKIYNNIFNNTENYYFDSLNNNTWNTTLQSSLNIIGGSYLGGNFWANPKGTGISQICTDADKDGICDSGYTLSSENIDYLPLKSPLEYPLTNVTPSLVFAITPNSRNAQIGIPVTLFMSVINYGTATAIGVSIAQASSLPATISYQEWDGFNFKGSANTPVDMPAGSTANFIITIDTTSAFNSSSLTFNVSGNNVAAAPVSAVNTLTISTSSTPSADVIMMSTSLDVSTGVNTATAFALATANVGGAGSTGVSLILSVPSTITGLAYQLNETNPDGSIKGPATGLTIGIGARPTFAVFLTPTQPIAYDPANNRTTLKLVDSSGNVIGAQSVAVSTT